MRRIAVINQKGGVGKTTTATNLAACLAEQGRRVVVVDMDPQANLSLHLGVEAGAGEASVYPVLLGRSTFAEALRPTETPGLSVAPSNIDLSGAELELASAIGRESLLRDAIERWEHEERRESGRAPADYLILDCPPSLGLLSVNALAAASEVIITVQTEFMALMGMSKLVEVVQLIRRRLNKELEVSGILPCLYDSRLRLAREVLAEIRKFFPGQVFEQPIRTNVKLAEAPSFGRTILAYAPESNGARDYRKVALEVIARESIDPELAALPAPRPLGELPTTAASEREPAAAPAPFEAPEELAEIVLQPTRAQRPPEVRAEEPPRERRPAAPAPAPAPARAGAPEPELPSLPDDALELPRGQRG